MDDDEKVVDIYDLYAEMIGLEGSMFVDNFKDLKSDERKEMLNAVKTYIESDILDRKDQVSTELKVRELEQKDQEIAISKWKLVIDGLKILVGIGTTAGVIYAATKIQATDYLLQEQGYMPSNLGKVAKLLTETEVRNNLPKV